MRRSNFLIGALVALATFIALSAFVGRRPWGGQRGWHYDRCYSENRKHNYQNDNDKPVRDRQRLTDSTTVQ